MNDTTELRHNGTPLPDTEHQHERKTTDGTSYIPLDEALEHIFQTEVLPRFEPCDCEAKIRQLTYELLVSNQPYTYGDIIQLITDPDARNTYHQIEGIENTDPVPQWEAVYETQPNQYTAPIVARLIYLEDDINTKPELQHAGTPLPDTWSPRNLRNITEPLEENHTSPPTYETLEVVVRSMVDADEPYTYGDVVQILTATDLAYKPYNPHNHSTTHQLVEGILEYDDRLPAP